MCPPLYVSKDLCSNINQWSNYFDSHSHFQGALLCKQYKYFNNIYIILFLPFGALGESPVWLEYKYIVILLRVL